MSAPQEMKDSTQDFEKRMINDIWLMTEYARENGIALSSVRKIVNLLQQYESGGKDAIDVDELIREYETVMSEAGDVTPETIIATKDVGKNFINYFNTQAGRHLLLLWIITGVAVIFLFVSNWLFESIVEMQDKLIPGEGTPTELASRELAFRAIGYLLPFIYGTLGSCAYLLRVTERHLRAKDFDPERLPEHWNRIILGTLSGGVIVIFIQDPDGIPVAEGALGFLAGYSIEFLFSVLDRMIAAILPKVGLDTIAREAEVKRNVRLVKKCKQIMSNPDVPEEQKKMAQEILDEYEK